MSWVAVAVSLLAAGASAYNTNRTAKKQDQANAEGMRRQAETQRMANARLNKTLTDAKASSPEATRKTAQDQYLAAIQQKLGQANANLKPLGVSSAYDADASAASAKNLGETNALAGLMSRMDAPALQRQAEQFSYGNLGMDLDRYAGNVQGDNFLTGLRVGGIRRNPYIDAAAAAAQGWASGRGAGTTGKRGGITATVGPTRRKGP